MTKIMIIIIKSNKTRSVLQYAKVYKMLGVVSGLVYLYTSMIKIPTLVIHSCSNLFKGFD